MNQETIFALSLFNVAFLVVAYIIISFIWNKLLFGRIAPEEDERDIKIELFIKKYKIMWILWFFRIVVVFFVSKVSLELIVDTLSNTEISLGTLPSF